MRNGHRDLKGILQKVYYHESLAGVDLRNLYLSCMDFSGLDLRQANFEGCRLSFGVLDGSDLMNANLTNANLTNTSFKETNLSGAIFDGAIVAGANFAGAKGLSSRIRDYLKSKGAAGLDENHGAAKK